MKKIVAVDYDGTIVDFDFPRSGAPKHNVKESLTLLRAWGYHVLIYSCRTCKWYPEIFCAPGEVLDMNRATIRDMIDTLDRNGIPYDEVDDGTKGKPPADFYIDDKGVRFTTWIDVLNFISTFPKP